MIEVDYLAARLSHDATWLSRTASRIEAGELDWPTPTEPAGIRASAEAAKRVGGVSVGDRGTPGEGYRDHPRDLSAHCTTDQMKVAVPETPWESFAVTVTV